jgi:RimJ/RimL family protein N-acetyltransferase
MSRRPEEARIRLRQPRPEDAGARLALGRDPEIVRRMFGGDTSRPLPPLAAREVDRWLEGLRAHPHAWIVEHADQLLGEVRLDGLDERDGRARLAIGFYDPTKLGIGLGQETVRLVLAHAFEVLGLHRIDLRVLA